MSHPYTNLDSSALWRPAVAEPDPMAIAGMARPRRKITPTDAVATAGSCFAQHISRRLRTNGFRFVDAEPAPPQLGDQASTYGYGLYSARFGNVYTTRQLLQLAQRAFRKFTPVERVWEMDGRFYDPFRPSIEPNGFASADEAIAVQDGHLLAVRRMFKRADVLVFTLGLTEMWADKTDGAAYPTCPGTIAGRFDPDRHVFTNLSYPEIMKDMRAFLALMRRANPDLHVMLTVSPVPLTATASAQHVLPATTYSKSVLRAAAGDLAAQHDNVSYFPSYEIITAPVFGGRFFEPNMRSVRPEGVDFVMKTFFREVCDLAPADEPPAPSPARPRPSKSASRDDMDVLCDEERLDPVAV